VREHKPAILGLGAYMSTTMLQMQPVIAELERQGLRSGLKVMVGACHSQESPTRWAPTPGQGCARGARKAIELVGG